MRPYPAARPHGLAPLAAARLRAGAVVPLDWAAEAVDAGRLLETRSSSRNVLGRRGARRLRRHGLVAAEPAA